MKKRIVMSLLAVVLPAEIASAQLIYQANLSGSAESPANASPAIGFAEVDYYSSTHLLHINLSFSGLTGTTTASHIHAATTSPGTGTAGVATTTPTFANFPLGVTSGTYDNTLDLTLAASWNSSYITAHGGITGAEVALAAALASNEAYLNIHTTTFGGGEIRGFLVPVPEPSTVSLAVVGLGLIAWRRRAAKSRATE